MLSSLSTKLYRWYLFHVTTSYTKMKVTSSLALHSITIKITASSRFSLTIYTICTMLRGRMVHTVDKNLLPKFLWLHNLFHPLFAGPEKYKCLHIRSLNHSFQFHSKFNCCKMTLLGFGISLEPVKNWIFYQFFSWRPPNWIWIQHCLVGLYRCSTNEMSIYLAH